MNKTIIYAFVILLSAIGLASAGSLVVSISPTISNGNVTGYVVSNTLIGSYNDANFTITVSGFTIHNGIVNGSQSITHAYVNPKLSQTLLLSQCGNSIVQNYNAGNISVKATSQPCLIYYANTVSLSPSSNSFNYSYGSYGNHVDIVVGSEGWKANKNITLNFTHSYINSTINLTVNPPKLSALNYYNKTLTINCSQNFTDQQLLLEVQSYKCPNISKVINVTPSWTANQTVSVNLFKGINVTVNTVKIKPIGVNTILAPSAFYRNSTYGLNITAMSVNAFVFNGVIENANYANSSYAKNCKHSFQENGTIICLDNLSSITTGDLIASHNVSGGVTKAFLDYQTSCRGNYSSEVSMYNSIYTSYERNGDPSNPDSNLSICRANILTAQKGADVLTSWGNIALLVGIAIIAALIYFRKKIKERLT